MKISIKKMYKLKKMKISPNNIGIFSSFYSGYLFMISKILIRNLKYRIVGLFFVLLCGLIDSKDMVYAMPSILLKDENLYDIVKYEIIALEAIGFRVISSISDNDVTNKLCLSLVVKQSFQLYIHIQL